MRLEASRSDDTIGPRIDFCAAADRQILHSIEGFDELKRRQVSSWFDVLGALSLDHEWRVQYQPQANVLVTLPSDNQRILVRYLDLRQQLDDQETDYL